MLDLSPIFDKPQISWVLHPGDDTQVAGQLSPLPEDDKPRTDLFANNLGYKSWDDLWDHVDTTPAGLGIGPKYWRTPQDIPVTLDSMMEPMRPWKEYLDDYQSWFQTLLTRKKLSLCISETSILSFVAPWRLSWHDRSAILSSDNGLWWTTLTITDTPLQFGDITFQPFRETEAIRSKIDTSLVACWSEAEARVIRKMGMGRPDPRVQAFGTLGDTTAWKLSNSLGLQHQFSQDTSFAVDGLTTLARLMLHKLNDQNP